MYKIVRFYQSDKMLSSSTIVTERGDWLVNTKPDHYHGMTIKDGLTLEEAQEHCDNKETSSRTCTDESHEQQYGPWFDGYTEE